MLTNQIVDLYSAHLQFAGSLLAALITLRWGGWNRD